MIFFGKIYLFNGTLKGGYLKKKGDKVHGTKFDTLGSKI